MPKKVVIVGKSGSAQSVLDAKGSVGLILTPIGAGVGGIATAARLAHAGFDVEVYEKNEFSGGRCSLIHHDGHRFDQVGHPWLSSSARGAEDHCRSSMDLT